jgi:hypothetical protein
MSIEECYISSLYSHTSYEIIDLATTARDGDEMGPPAAQRTTWMCLESEEIT